MLGEFRPKSETCHSRLSTSTAACIQIASEKRYESVNSLEVQNVQKESE